MICAEMLGIGRKTTLTDIEYRDIFEKLKNNDLIEHIEKFGVTIYEKEEKSQ